MKSIVILCLTILAALAGRAQGTAFTYNGRLNENGGAVNGDYEFSFSVYDVAANGVPVAGPLTVTPVAVANGLFTAVVDFGPGIFTGPPRFLAISVRPVSGGAFQPVTPRQELTSSPYAIHAVSAGTAAGVADGVVVKSVNNLHDAVTLSAGANLTITPNGNTLTLAAAGVGGSGIWSVLNNNAFYNSGNVGIGTTTPTSKLEIAAQDGLAITGFQPFLTLRDSGAGNARGIIQNGGGNLLFYPQSFIGGSPAVTISSGSGTVGIGTPTPTAGYRLEVTGATILRPGNGSVQFGSPNAELGQSITPTLGNRADLRFNGSTLKLVAGPGTGPPPAEYGITISTNGGVGIGTTSSSSNKLEVAGNTRLNGRINVNYHGGGVPVTMNIQASEGDTFPLNVRANSGSTVFYLRAGATHELYMLGDAYKSSGGTAWIVSSDQRLKQDVRPYEPGLNEVLQLRPVRFRYRDDPKRGLTSTHEEVGFIAQAVREVIPNAVTEGPDGYLSLKADPIHWAAINAIQELNTKLEEQRAENAELRQRLDKLEQRMNQTSQGQQ